MKNIFITNILQSDFRIEYVWCQSDTLSQMKMLKSHHRFHCYFKQILHKMFHFRFVDFQHQDTINQHEIEKFHRYSSFHDWNFIILNWNSSDCASHVFIKNICHLFQRSINDRLISSDDRVRIAWQHFRNYDEQLMCFFRRNTIHIARRNGRRH